MKLIHLIFVFQIMLIGCASHEHLKITEPYIKQIRFHENKIEKLNDRLENEQDVNEKSEIEEAIEYHEKEIIRNQDLANEASRSWQMSNPGRYEINEAYDPTPRDPFD